MRSFRDERRVIGGDTMWNEEEKPSDMPLEEWVWITGQHKHKDTYDENDGTIIN